MTHLYTILVGGTVIRGTDDPHATAIAWADDTILAIGSDDDVRTISRGDSHLVDLRGAVVIPLGKPLVVGGVADLVVVEPVARAAPHAPDLGAGPTRPGPAIAIVRSGRVMAGSLEDIRRP